MRNRWHLSAGRRGRLHRQGARSACAASQVAPAQVHPQFPYPCDPPGNDWATPLSIPVGPVEKRRPPGVPVGDDRPGWLPLCSTCSVQSSDWSLLSDSTASDLAQHQRVDVSADPGVQAGRPDRRRTPGARSAARSARTRPPRFTEPGRLRVATCRQAVRCGQIVYVWPGARWPGG